jgi:hypothetical protein
MFSVFSRFYLSSPASLHLPLETRNFLLRLQLLDGANAYQCDGCCREVRAVRNIKLYGVAPVVVLALKRLVYTATSPHTTKVMNP